jgi:mono/diheme cytochrome c family protein
MKLAYLALFAFVALFLQGCYDSEGYSKYTKLQYVPDMADAPRTKPYLSYLDPPEHSVSRDTWIYRSTHELSEKFEKNPYAATPRIVAEGKELYLKMCVACHTKSGKGQHKLKGFPNPPDITNSAYLDREDGYFFHLITFGSKSGLMPSLGHATSISERWKIIHYIRTMQRKGE